MIMVVICRGLVGFGGGEEMEMEKVEGEKRGYFLKEIKVVEV